MLHPPPSRVHDRLIDQLYHEAMLLADEARDYFDEGGRREREALDPLARVAFSCESLKVTTRLMHAIAWLLTQRAIRAGELAPEAARDPSRRLGTAPELDETCLASMPPTAQALIRASAELYRRVARFDAVLDGSGPAANAARLLQARLASAF